MARSAALQSNPSLVDIDRDHLIHSVTSFREAKGVTILQAGRGMYLTDNAGHELIDAISGQWCVNVGF